MDWEIRKPKAWDSIRAWRNRKTFCASTDKGEYFIVQGNGRFAIELDGVAITGFDATTAVEAMTKAEELHTQLSSHLNA